MKTEDVNTRRSGVRTALLLVVALALAGCGKNQQPPAGLAPVEKEGKAAANAVQTAAKNPKGTASDISITTKVKTAFGLNKILNGTDINVTTNNGVVALDGTVANEKQVTEAARQAKTVEGVQDVRNNLKVGNVEKAGKPGSKK